MSSWVPSWFAFPTFDVSILPNLQRKFFSFVLKRFLGHLLKPGQLNIEQIDSAIGSGNLTVNDLKLECTSINTLLSGLPIQLHEGGIASVSVRMPWPNPLTSGVELSVRSPELVFHLLPRVEKDVPLPSTNLTDSISEAAQLFAHEEITHEESTEAYQAFLSSGAPHANNDDDYVPGGLNISRDDPEVLSDVDPTGISVFASMFEYLLTQFKFTAKDIRITVIHPGHSSFRLKISELHYGRPTSGHDESTRTAVVSGIEIAHCDLSTSESPRSSHLESSSFPSALGENNASSQRIDGIAPFSTIMLPSSPPPSSSPMDTSDANESMPLVGSVPHDHSRPSSPSASTSSSSFRSALTTQDSKPEPGSCDATIVRSQGAEADSIGSSPGVRAVDDPLPADEGMEDEISRQFITLLATDSIVVHITTSAPPVSLGTSVQTQSSPHTSESDPSGTDSRQPNLEISVSVAIVACALSATQINAILGFISTIGSHSGPSIQPQVSHNVSLVVPQLSLLDQATLTIQIRGFVLLLQSTPASPTGSLDVPLTDFFTHPLTPPKTDHSYVRLLIDRLRADLSVSTTLQQLEDEPTPSSEHLPGRSRVPRVVRRRTSTQIRFFVGDLSVFAFCVRSNATAPPAPHEAFAIPIILTDPFLSSQYRFEHHPSPGMERHVDISPEFVRNAFPALPEFEISDWTSENNRISQAKLSFWRVKPPPSYRRSQKNHPGDPTMHPHAASSPNTVSEETTVNELQSALSGQVLLSSAKDQGSPESTCSIHINIIPLHIFVDIGYFATALDFLDILSLQRSRSGSTEPQQGHGGSRRRGSSGELTPRSSSHRTTLQRIHQQELEDLNLSVDYLPKESPLEEPSPELRKTHRHAQREQDQHHRNGRPEFDINFALIRVQLRCPSPPSRLQRSGAVVVDIHRLTLASWSSLRDSHLPGTKTESTHRHSSSRENHLLTVEWHNLLLACSSPRAGTATGFCSIGPLSSAADSNLVAPHDHVRFQDDASLTKRFAFLKLSQNPPSLSGRNSKPCATVVAEIEIPSILLALSKPLFDGFQFWIDDVSQLLERTITSSSEAVQENSSRNPSLVGSRFFSGSKQGSVEIPVDETSPDNMKSSTESVVKVTISEASISLLVPRVEGESRSMEPLGIFVSDVDALLEFKPEGKDETVVSLSIMGITVQDAVNPIPYPILSLAAQRSLFSAPKPVIKLLFTSIAFPEINSKESRVKLSLHGFTLNLFPDVKRIDALVAFAKPPPGVFESVVPSERTRITVKIADGSARLFVPHHTGALVVHFGDTDFGTEVVGDSPEIQLRIAGQALTALFTDNHLEAVQASSNRSQPDVQGPLYWKKLGYALISEASDLALTLRRSNNGAAQSEVTVDRIAIRIHLCADTGSTLGLYFSDLGTAFEERSQQNISSESLSKRPTVVSTQESSSDELAYSIDQHAFRGVPEVGAAPDMIYDDLPSNPDYLDVSFGAAAGLRELNDDDIAMDDPSETEQTDHANLPSYSADHGVVSSVGGETIKLLDPNGLHVVENFFNTLPALVETSPQLAEELDRVVIRQGEVTLFFYEGYDWAATRKVIEDEVKKMKRRLTRIKQLVASGQTYDPSIDPTNTVLFNSIHLGLDQDADEMEPDALIAAIDEELKEDIDTASVSSWQSLRPTSSGRPHVPQLRLHGRRLTRSRSPSIEIHLSGLFTETVKFVPNDEIVSRTFATVKDVEILDHVKTSTWRKFLTALRSDSRGNIRETGSDMVRIELRSVHPVPGNTSEETRLRVKILPLRLHVDQDALDFLKKFFNFQNPNVPSQPEPRSETYLQRAEVYPVVLKLDYKPRRVDYRALRDGRTIELMNFFHFDGAEMTLRRLTLFGVAGWPRFFDMLNDLWTPDVKATQLADVISGVSPIRSVVNVGSGVADLVLLPIAQYRKDGRVVRGLQKGTKAFVRSTAMEAVKLGAHLATGTQVILEQAENVLGSNFNETILAETVPHPFEDAIDTDLHDSASESETADPISRYAQQPVDIREGIQSAYTSMRRNLSSAAQTILAVPMEVFERSGTEASYKFVHVTGVLFTFVQGPVRAVIRAVPIAVLRPMIGASEAVSKTLLGLHNSLDPEIRHENAAKYKHR
ncbi:hypothetical protein BC827DRAFT_1374003 [Russula dissimulans]|nr:hypothetical protein BC827DRAFT_1374003 [Russula dissimulans]